MRGSDLVEAPLSLRRDGGRPPFSPAFVRLLPFALVTFVALASLPALTPAAAAEPSLVLKVGGQDEMKTRNVLPAIANDVWTSDVLFRAYSSVLLSRPTLDQPMAYIGKGVDFDEDGMFEVAEYDRWAEQSPASSQLVVTVYYDFNGVEWHDGTQMTPWDLLFSYHLNAMNPRFNTDLRVIFCGIGLSYETCGRQLALELVDLDSNPANGYQKNWEGEGTMAGDPNLRVAVRYTLNQPFALFYESTLYPVMMPLHVWSRTGGGRHLDFGCAIWLPSAEAIARGVPACQNADPTKWGDGIASTESVPGSTPYSYLPANTWNPANADVIGNGPFKFDSWVPGVEANVVRYDRYYTGTDPDDAATVYDARLNRILTKPTIEGIRYKVYKTTQLGVFALQSAEIDFYHWNVGAEFVPDLLANPAIAVESNAEPGFFYMAYNMRREPWGYVNNDPQQGDRGYWFRQAVSHLADKKSIVQNLLQNFGVVGHGVVSPANTFWYTDNIPKPGYDLATARAILDDLATPGGIYDPGFTLDPGSTTDCNQDNPAGCRSLPRIGNGVIEILMPLADYDPVRAFAGAIIVDSMRQVGLNARAAPPRSLSPFVRDFDLFILGWRIGGTDPDYLFSFFHSANAPSGQNYPGVRNATLDAILDASRREMNRTVRQQRIHEAQLLLADIRPYEVLYYRTNIEGYRQDRFVNWTVVSGSIWNEWSLFGVRPPGGFGVLNLVVTAASAIASGASDNLVFAVHDASFAAVGGATVSVQIGAGDGGDPGTLTAGTQSGTSLLLTTDAGGTARAAYSAPRLFGTTRPILVSARASHPAYESPATDQVLFTVFGEDLGFLAVRLSLPTGDVAYPNTPVPVRLDVRDADGVPQSETHVVVELQPGGNTSFTEGTAHEGRAFSVDFPDPGIYTIRADATGEPYVQAWSYVTVWVLPPANVTGPPEDGGPRGTDVVPLFLSVAVAAAIIGVVCWRVGRLRRRDRT